jgi:outer membrane lipoprotein-sorting protein
MRKKWSSSLASLVLAVIGVGSAEAELAGQEFSAEMVQRGPEGQMSSGKMYVGDGRMRSEMVHQGQQVVRITDETRGVEWVLFPEQKKYMERQLASSAGPQPGMMQSASEDPCAGAPGLTCRKLGEETVSGRTAVKWEIVAAHQGQTVKTTQWIDKERGVPLRQELPNDQTTELKLVGEETLNGRPVEKWEMVATTPNQQPIRTFQWFDPELKLAVRQEFPGGFVSELNELNVGKQPDHLFTIPAGYERLSAPQGMPGGPGSGGMPGTK